MKRLHHILGAVAGIGVVALTVPSGAQSSNVDLTHLPLGKTVTTPTKGGLWTCRTNYDPTAAGAQSTGPWIDTANGTWDKTKKYVVDGDVAWPNASFSVKRQGTKRAFTTNELPTDHTTGVFPVASTDDAHLVDQNPNGISEQSITFEVPLNPRRTAQPSCVGGEVGILKSGVASFNAVDAGGRDAEAYETQDRCDGHPQNSGLYHYHAVSSCVLAKLDSGTGQSKLVGWAFDGFGIYGPRGADGQTLTNAELDECHGITSKVVFNGKKQRIYHYVATDEYPYAVGCFRGTSGVTGPLGGGGGAGGGPPAP